MAGRSILVPIDFSGDSINALDMAIYVAGEINGSIEMLYVKPERSIFSVFGIGNPEYSEEEISENFKTLHSQYGNKGISLTHSMREGKISREIVAEANRTAAFLIVMGTHGASGFEEFWVGSNTFRVVSQAPCPVLSLRATFHRREFRNMVLPLDNTPETRQKVPFLIDFACYFRSLVHVLAVIAEGEDEEAMAKLKAYQQQVCEFMSEGKANCKKALVRGDAIANEILKYTKKVNADLICIMTEQEPNDDSLTLGEYAQHIVNHSRVPVLSLRPKSVLEAVKKE